MPRFNDLGEGKIEGRKLDPREVVIRPGFNFRDITTPTAQAHIAWLKQSIRERGVQEPIRVEYSGGVAYLVNGQCRVEACKQLWEEGVKIPYKDGGEGPPLCPAIVVTGDEAEILAASITANGGLPPTKLEFGAAAKRLIALGWSPERVALYTPPHIKAGQSARYVREAVELHEAPLAVKAAVTSGIDGVRVSESLALQAVRENKDTAVATVTEAAHEAKAKGETVARRPKAAPARTVQPDEELLQKINALREDTAAVDLFDESQGYIEVDRKMLLDLFQYAESLV